MKNNSLTGVPESRIFIFESRERASSAILVFGFFRQCPSSKTTQSQAFVEEVEFDVEEEDPAADTSAAAAAVPFSPSFCFFFFFFSCNSSLLCRSIP